MENLTDKQKQIRDEKSEGISETLKQYIPDVDPTYLLPSELVTHIQFDIAQRKNVLLTGHMGVGKSSVFQQIAANLKRPFMRVNLNQQMSISDFVGYNTAENGNLRWIDGFLPFCMRNGVWLVLDEIDAAEAGVLTAIQSVTEYMGSLMLKEKACEIVKPHSSFRIFATANTVGCMEEFRHMYVGTNPMNAALVDRFRVYKVDYLAQADEIKVLSRKVPECPESACAGLVALATEIRAGFVAQKFDKPLGTRSLIDLAEMIVRLLMIDKSQPSGTPRMSAESIMMKAVELCVLSKVPTQDALALKELTASIMG
jgi:cobaltochelatase CobS